MTPNINLGAKTDDRLSPDVPAKGTRIDVVIETDHPATMNTIVERLHAKGFARARIIDTRL